MYKCTGGDSKCTAACQFGGVCLNGICTCQDKCTAKPYPICAKDGKTVSFKYFRIYLGIGSWIGSEIGSEIG